MYDEHKHTLQIYWSERDVITWLAENSDDEHLKKYQEFIKKNKQAADLSKSMIYDNAAELSLY